MTSRFYDVVVIGRSLGTLTVAALLARRDFSVLLLGQGQLPPAYSFDGIRLKRRSFTLLFGRSPVWKRILHDLAQSPSFKRRVRSLDPMFAVLAPGSTLEVPPDRASFASEIDREFPEIRQVVDDLYSRLGQVNAAVDAAYERDLVWPPGTLWERFETGRVASRLPLIDSESPETLLGKFPAEHCYRDFVTWPARFASDLLAADMPTLALARLHGNWTGGLQSLAHGEEELEDFLLDRFQAHGGVVALDQRASEILVKRGRVSGVAREGESDPVGTDHVVSNLNGEGVAELARGVGLSKAALRSWPRIAASAGRFVASLLLRASGVPERLPEESFLFPRRLNSPRHPVVHLQNLPGATAETRLFVAEMLLPRYGALNVLEAREAVLATVRDHFPFLDEHLLVADSPHDGLPLSDYRGGERRAWARTQLHGGSAEAEDMLWQWSLPARGFLGFGAEPVRGPVAGSFLVGSTVLPGLGQEGELMAAWSAARIITRKDRVRENRRRQLWTKIETT